MDVDRLLVSLSITRTEKKFSVQNWKQHKAYLSFFPCSVLDDKKNIIFLKIILPVGFVESLFYFFLSHSESRLDFQYASSLGA